MFACLMMMQTGAAWWFSRLDGLLTAGVGDVFRCCVGVVMSQYEAGRGQLISRHDEEQTTRRAP